MFTGLVQTLAVVRQVWDQNGGRLLIISAPHLPRKPEVGDSISVNGACLTVAELRQDGLAFCAVPETLRKTNLGELANGEPVNLECALRVGDPLGGHWVQGHVDGVGRIVERRPEGQSVTMRFACPTALCRQMVPKGSIAVDGVSLTLVEVGTDDFSVALIPHTLANTTLGQKPVGATVNLETDILAKYVAKILANRESASTCDSA
jgi:riboflavin synthase